MSRKIYLNAEHGGTDSGAFANGIKEKDANLKVARAAWDYLSGYECLVIMSRDTDKALPVNDRVAQVRAQRPDLAVTIAHNAGGGDGCEVYYWHTDNRAKAFAQELIKQFGLIGQNSRGVKPSKPGTNYNFGMCREPAAMGITAVLGEFAFLDNKTDVQIVDSDADLKREGEAYAKAIIAFLGLQKKTAPQPKPDASGKIEIGDIAQFVGGAVYSASNATAAASTRGASRCKVTNTATGAKHPYHCISQDGKGVYGWVDAAAVGAASGGNDAKPENLYAKGRAVRLNNTALYGSASTKTAASRKTGTYYIYDGVEINGRYRITNSAANCGKTPTGQYVTGYINKADIR